jgi:membrane protease YdiL (CAAX protease family)
MENSSIFRDGEGGLRSGWRFVIFALLFFSLAALIGGAADVVVSRIGGVSSSISLSIFDALILVAALTAGWLCNRVLEGLPFKALGASFDRGWHRRFAAGLAVGALTLGFAVLICLISGGLSFDADQESWGSIADSLLFALVIFTIAAASEEALARGYPMQTFFHSDMKAFGILFTAALFAAAHLGNQNADWISTLNTFLAGIWFGVAYLRTGDLWFPFGIHLMWNWMLGAFFGIEVSGISSLVNAPLLRELDRGPGWLTGLDYGIEAGIACTVAIMVSIVVILMISPRKYAD